MFYPNISRISTDLRTFATKTQLVNPSMSSVEVCCLEVGEVRQSRQADRYVRRRQRQNVTMGGQPATPLEAVRAEVLIVQVLGHFLQVLHVGSVGKQQPS